MRLSSLFERSSSGSGIGMRLSVWCAEETPFSSADIIEMKKLKYPQVAELSPMVFKQDVCDVWNVEAFSRIENEAVKSDIPVLLISGEYDYETPLRWAESMVGNLSHSYHLIFKGWSHTPTTNWGDKCAMKAVNDFFNNPEVNPNPSCFDKIKGLEFRTN